MSGLDDEARACSVALAALSGVGPARLRALLEHAGDAVSAWAAVRSGALDGVDLRRTTGRAELVSELQQAARRIEPAQLLEAHRRADVQVLLPGDDAWPAVLTIDPEPPGVLFVRGDVALLDEVAVAVVGTRRCSAVGVRIAGELGADLAAAGVHVVSGLALGIDGAAHRGALAAGGRPVGVVGSGLDVVYPPQHRRLWADVGEAGVLVSEAPLGRPPERWRFPARNRVIAALAAAVVVVESRVRGGSMSTVDAALERQRTVLAVPGSVAAEQSAGTNQLLAEGAPIARSAADVLDVLGLQAPPPERRGSAAELPPDLGEPARAVAAALGPGPAGVEHLAAAAGLDVAVVLTALARLEAAGFARRVPGGYEQVVR